VSTNVGSRDWEARAEAPGIKKQPGVLKNPPVYDKFSSRMSSPRGSATAIALTVLACLLAMALVGCNVAPAPGRFTYVVKYEVVADGDVAIDIAYTDETSAVIPVTPIPFDAANPWSYQFPAAFNYDDPSFYPTLDVTATSGLDADESVTAKIIWKDYRSDFEEQVLVLGSLYNDGLVVVDTVTLTGPELPRP
jgi:hypothetical protein